LWPLGRVGAFGRPGGAAMIKHIVMWKVRGDDAQSRAANIALVQREFESLRGRIPGLLHLEIGVDDSRIDYACDVVLVTEFDSRLALAAYAEHPEHLRVRRALGDLRTTRHQVDYEFHPEAGRVRADRDTPSTHRGDKDHVQTL
jgi:Stress responsive A/B Barrel Domain